MSKTAENIVKIQPHVESNATGGGVTLARDKIAQAYFGTWGGEETSNRAQRRINWIGSQVTGETVLDIGCSEGILPVLLGREGYKVLGIDVNQDAIAYGEDLRLKENPFVQSNISFKHCDALSAELPLESFDTVVIGEVIEHLLRPELMLQRAAALLKTGGQIVITTPFGFMPDPDHKQTYSLTDVAKLLRGLFAVEFYDVQDGYICFVGTKSENTRDSWNNFGTAEILKKTEIALIDSQTRLRERIDVTREKLENSWAAQEKQKSIIQSLEKKTQHLGQAETELRDRVYNLLLNLSELQSGLSASLKHGESIEEELLILQEGAALQKIAQEESQNKLRAFENNTQVRNYERQIQSLEVDLRYQQFRNNFANFVQNVRDTNPEHFVFMFSGTTFIQTLRANRPIRLTKCFQDIEVPVLFNYHRWRETHPIPDYEGNTLFQSPIDYTQLMIPEYAQMSLGPQAKKIFVVSYPHPCIPKILNRFNANGWITIYDCRDDWEEFHTVGQAKWFTSAAEKYIVKNCDAVTCVSKPLRDKMQQYDSNKEVEVLPNAYDPLFRRDFFQKRKSNKTKIGYFGHLTSAWFDWESLAKMAAARPAYTFEIIGHGAPEDLNLPSNVVLLGPKEHEEINVIAAEWDTAIICFKVGLLADGVDPIKIYEYLSLGIPVVSFRMPQIDNYPFTETVNTVDEFVVALDKSLDVEFDTESVEQWLSENTWAHRSQRMIDIAEDIASRSTVEKTFGGPKK